MKAVVFDMFETLITLFDHLHPEIIPMLEALKAAGIKVALISNCFFEERDAIKKSALLPYFDVACLSCDIGMKKTDADIFAYCHKTVRIVRL